MGCVALGFWGNGQNSIRKHRIAVRFIKRNCNCGVLRDVYNVIGKAQLLVYVGIHWGFGRNGTFGVGGF